MAERLQKVLASAGIASRRKAEKMIRAGRVQVNGRVVQQMGLRVDGQRDDIRVDGHPISRQKHPVYLLVNKPRGVVSTVHDERGRPTVVDLVGSDERLYPVGRLDMDSEGLMLLTNDGDLAHVLTHPRFAHEKEYRVLVRGQPTRIEMRELRQGVSLDDGLARPDRATLLKQDAQGTWLSIVIHEGRKRQIRRMLAAIGHPVVRLVRARMGPLELGQLGPGESRPLTEVEIMALTDLMEAGRCR